MDVDGGIVLLVGIMLILFIECNIKYVGDFVVYCYLDYVCLVVGCVLEVIWM